MRIIGSNDKGFKALLSEILTRGEQDTTLVEEAVKEIIKAVKDRGDEALIEYTKRFDKADISRSIEVPASEAEKALKAVPEGDLDIMRLVNPPTNTFREQRRATER